MNSYRSAESGDFPCPATHIAGNVMLREYTLAHSDHSNLRTDYSSSSLLTETNWNVSFVPDRS